MEKFVHTDDFKALNIGLSLDEGIANPNNAYRVFYGERTAWLVSFYRVASNIC
jgi:aminoacylase